MTKLVVLSLTALPLFAAHVAHAQEAIDYSAGDYEYAQADAKPADTSPPDRAEDHGAQRVIPARQDGSITFVERPVIQPIPSVEPNAYTTVASQGDGAGMAAQGVAPVAPAVVAAQDQVAVVGPDAPTGPRLVDQITPAPGTVLYVYPAIYGTPPEISGGASGSIDQRRNGRQGNYTYVYESGQPPVPAGGRLVEFDRAGWLDECSRRITPRRDYEGDYDDRGEPDAAVSNDSYQRCEAYLDGYMASARTGGLAGQTSSSGQYMLVPVTVMVPQRAVYSDGTPVVR